MRRPRLSQSVGAPCACAKSLVTRRTAQLAQPHWRMTQILSPRLPQRVAARQRCGARSHRPALGRRQGRRPVCTRGRSCLSERAITNYERVIASTQHGLERVRAVAGRQALLLERQAGVTASKTDLMRARVYKHIKSSMINQLRTN